MFFLDPQLKLGPLISSQSAKLKGFLSVDGCLNERCGLMSSLMSNPSPVQWFLAFHLIELAASNTDFTKQFNPPITMVLKYILDIFNLLEKLFFIDLTCGLYK